MGTWDGAAVGLTVGDADGMRVGCCDGRLVGVVGPRVGFCVGGTCTLHTSSWNRNDVTSASNASFASTSSDSATESVGAGVKWGQSGLPPGTPS